MFRRECTERGARHSAATPQFGAARIADTVGELSQHWRVFAEGSGWLWERQSPSRRLILSFFQQIRIIYPVLLRVLQVALEPFSSLSLALGS